jgi:DNA-binding transcriptional LysR family regulator
METSKYRLLLKTVEMGNLTKAAAELGYTQSSASYVLNSIEKELGLRLLVRDHSGTHLTPEGTLLLPAFREAVSSEDKIRTIVNSISGMQVGTLKIGAFTSISLMWLPNIIGQFHRKFPQIQIEILSGRGSYQEIQDFLLEGIADCSFICEPASPGLHSIRLFEDPLRVVLPKEHPLAGQKAPISLFQLENEPFLMPSEGNCTDIKNLCQKYHFSPKVAFTMQEDLSLLAMVENGLGCTILPNLILSNYSHDTAVREIAGNPTRMICIATRNGEILSPLVVEFIRAVREIVFQRANPMQVEG